MRIKLLLCLFVCVLTSACTSTTNQYVLFETNPVYDNGYVQIKYVNGNNPAKVWVDPEYPVYVDAGAKVEYLQSDDPPTLLHIQVGDFEQVYSITSDVRTTASSSYTSEEENEYESEVEGSVEIE